MRKHMSSCLSNVPKQLTHKTITCSSFRQTTDANIMTKRQVNTTFSVIYVVVYKMTVSCKQFFPCKFGANYRVNWLRWQYCFICIQKAPWFKTAPGYCCIFSKVILVPTGKYYISISNYDTTASLTSPKNSLIVNDPTLLRYVRTTDTVAK
jgi:hypothetical protein